MMDMKTFRGMVNAEVVGIAGISVDDLADFDMWGYFSEEYAEDEAMEAAKECAIALLEDEGFPLEDEDYE